MVLRAKCPIIDHINCCTCNNARKLKHQNMKILVTGASGFISGYLIEDLLNHGLQVIGSDNFSKYGHVDKSMES